jgi:hydroxyacylglutathione hydrolase
VLVEPETLAAGIAGPNGHSRAAAIVLDTRPPEAFAAAHIPGAYSIWAAGVAPYAGWVAGPQTRVYLCTGADDEVDAVILQLARIGIDGVCGALRGGFATWRSSGRALASTSMITAEALAEQLDAVTVVDVRGPSEFAAGHIPEAILAFVGELVSELEPLAAVARSRPVAVTCDVGHRASLAASVLARAGFSDVRNLLGGMQAWTAAGLPTR